MNREIKLIYEISKNDFKTKYAGSFLGIIWGFLLPVATILVYWFVFTIGFRSGIRDDGTPFIVWLTCGMAIWFFFSEAIIGATNSYIEYSYLVKKIAFRIGILPAVKILSSLFSHLFFLGIVCVVLIFYGYYPNIVYVQLIYYIICSCFLLFGLSLITSALVVFVRDITQIMGVFIQIGFWLIPIVWSTELLSGKYEKLFKLNPVYYLVEGYRDTLINHIWFWSHYNQTLYFWLFSSIIFLISVFIFKRLKPHFSDML